MQQLHSLLAIQELAPPNLPATVVSTAAASQIQASYPPVQVRLAAGGAIAALLEGPQQKAYLAIAELKSSERQTARYSTHAIVDSNTIALIKTKVLELACPQPTWGCLLQ